MTLETNGLIERFFRSLKEECVWLQRFADFAEARRAIAAWIGWYNAECMGHRHRHRCAFSDIVATEAPRAQATVGRGRRRRAWRRASRVIRST